MPDAWDGNERRKDAERAALKEAVAEAVRETLQGMNIIDGPTHVAHHQAIAEALSMARHAKKTAIGVFVKGACGLFLLGFLTWVWGSRGQ